MEVSSGGGATYVELAAGEWLAYSSDAALTGSYGCSLIASSTSGATAHLTVDGVDATGPFTIPITGGQSAFQSIALPNLSLTEGRREIRLVMASGIASVDRLDFSLLVARQQTIIDNVGTWNGGFPVSISGTRFTASGWSDKGTSLLGNYYGADCLIANGGVISATAAYRPHLLYTGDYAVDVWYPQIIAPYSPAQFTSNQVPVTVVSDLGTTSITLNQQVGHQGEGARAQEVGHNFVLGAFHVLQRT